MQKIFYSITLFLFLALGWTPLSNADRDFSVYNDILNNLVLPLATPEEITYFNFETTDHLFSVNAVETHVVIVEVLSIYCPHCQQNASQLNRFYDLIKNKDSVKLFGIASGNTALELKTFTNKFDVRFPVFVDTDGIFAHQMAVKHTPHFIIAVRQPDNSFDIIFSESGGFDKVEQFIRNTPGLIE